jgi:outer membrane receptor protein involved in Fe transport
LGLQASWLTARNTLAFGGTYDGSDSDFTQTSAEGEITPDRGVRATEDPEVENILEGETTTWSLYFTDTFKPNDAWAITLSGRYNHTNVKTTDKLDLVPPNLDGDHTYTKFNPAIGATYLIKPSLTTYAGWNQGSRAPSPIELGCADPDNPCTLPAGLASDPFLEQVVAQTVEAGFRGLVGSAVNWNAGLFRTNNKDDILFVSAGTAGQGYFTNFGKTRRQGLELGLTSSPNDRFNWSVNYSYIDATFQDSACLVAEGNSSRGSSGVCAEDDEILVSPGDSLPAIPEHQFRLVADYWITSRWSFGGSMVAFSDSYAYGNENNQHQQGTFNIGGEDETFLGNGKVGGYTVANLTTRYRFNNGLELFGKITNLFDKRYASTAILGENVFGSNGSFLADPEDWTNEQFDAPGAPLGAFVGIKYRFGGKPPRN